MAITEEEVFESCESMPLLTVSYARTRPPGK